jgi:hypothetical protein
VSELGKFDQNVALGTISGKDPFFVVVEVAVTNGKIDAFLPNRCTIVVRNSGATKFDVLNYRVVACDYPNPFALGALACGINSGASISDSSNSQPIRCPSAYIACIDTSRINFDDIARTAVLYGPTRRCIPFARPDLEHFTGR